LTRTNESILARIQLGAVEEVYYEGAGGTRVQGWLVKPPGFDPQKKYPGVVLVHGGPQSVWGNATTYRWNAQLFAAPGYVVFLPNPRGSVGWGQKFVDEISGDWSGKLGWVGHGFSIASLDCRGQAGLSEDVGGVRGTTHHGDIIRGLLDAPEHLLFRQIFLDTVELARIVMSFDEVDADRVGALGGSQGGALTLACAALEPRIRRAAPTFPFLCDYQRVWEMDLAEGAYAELRAFFRHHDPTHARAAEWFEKLGYIDIQHLAPRIRAEVLMGIGLMDKICPPSTQFAAYNKIRAPKRRIVYPDFGHEGLPGFSDRVWEFLSQL